MSQSREEWIAMMLDFMVRWLSMPAAANGVAFTCDYFASEAFLQGYPEPEDSRDWGAVFQRAKRRKIIKVLMVDGRPATGSTPAKHRTPLWVAA